jgi:hypothetical protein
MLINYNPIDIIAYIKKYIPNEIYPMRKKFMVTENLIQIV